MVARNRRVISDSIHQFNGQHSLRHHADGFSLHSVTVVHQQHMFAPRLCGILDGLQAYQRKALVNPAVNVAGKQHKHVVRQPLRRCKPDPQANRQNQQQSRNLPNSLHKTPSFFYYLSHFGSTEPSQVNPSGKVIVSPSQWISIIPSRMVRMNISRSSYWI